MSYSRVRNFGKPDLLERQTAALWTVSASDCAGPISPGTLTPTYLPNVLLKAYGKVVSDNVTPDYYKRIKAGDILPVNEFNSDEWSYLVAGEPLVRESWEGIRTAPSCTGNYWRGVNHDVWPGTVIPTKPNHLTVSGRPTDTYLVDKALQAARNRLFDLATFVAQYRQVVEAWTDVSQRADDAVTWFRSKEGRKALKEEAAYVVSKAGRAPVMAASNLFLATKYGHALTASDLLDLSKLLSRLLAGDTSNTLRGSFAFSGSAQSQSTVIKAGYNNASLWWDVTTNTTLDSKGFAILRGGITVSGLSLDPINAAYETIPLSFIYDWLVDYGAILAALSPFGTGEVVGSGIVDYRVTECTAVLDGSKGIGNRRMAGTDPFSYFMKGPQIQARRKTIHRYSVKPGLTYPPLTLPKNWQQYAVIGAVMLQLRGAIGRYFTVPPGTYDD